MVLVALYLLLPRLAGLEHTWQRVRDGSPGWFGAAVCYEAISFLGYVWLLRRVAGVLSWPAAWRITLAGVGRDADRDGGGRRRHRSDDRRLMACRAVPAAGGRAPGLPELVMAYLAGDAFSVLPMPGGVGPVEGGLIAALIAFGEPAGLRAGRVLSYLLVSVWLPAGSGAAALVRQRRHCTMGRAGPRDRDEQPRRRSSPAMRSMSCGLAGDVTSRTSGAPGGDRDVRHTPGPGPPRGRGGVRPAPCA